MYRYVITSRGVGPKGYECSTAEGIASCRVSDDEVFTFSQELWPDHYERFEFFVACAKKKHPFRSYLDEHMAFEVALGVRKSLGLPDLYPESKGLWS